MIPFVIFCAVTAFDSSIMHEVLESTKASVEHTQYNHSKSGNASQSFLNDGTHYATNLRVFGDARGDRGTRLTYQANLRFSDDTQLEPVHANKAHLLTAIARYEVPDRYRVSIGDVVSSFSQYTLSRSLEGFALEKKFGGLIDEFVVSAGKTARARSRQSFDRYSGGARARGRLGSFGWGLNFSGTYDDPSRADSSLTRAVNRVGSLTWQWEREGLGPLKYLAWEGEVARSWDKTGPAYGARRYEDGDAARTEIRAKVSRLDLGVALERVERLFSTLSGSAASDQVLARPTLRYVFSPRLFVQLGYTGFHDNLDDRGATTMNRAVDGVVSARPTFPKIGEVPLTYAFRQGEVKRGDRATDQTTTSQNLSASYAWRGYSLSTRAGHTRLSDVIAPQNENIRRTLGADLAKTFAPTEDWSITPTLSLSFDRVRQNKLNITRGTNAGVEFRFRDEFTLSARSRYNDVDQTVGGRSEAVSTGTSFSTSYQPRRIPRLLVAAEYTIDDYNFDGNARDYGEERLQGRINWEF